MSLIEYLISHEPSTSSQILYLFCILGLISCIGDFLLSFKDDHPKYSTMQNIGYTIKYTTKPLLLPLLSIHYYLEATNRGSLSIILLISFSLAWLGTLALMPKTLTPNDKSTLLGMLLFIFAHVSYLYQFYSLFTHFHIIWDLGIWTLLLHTLPSAVVFGWIIVSIVAKMEGNEARGPPIIYLSIMCLMLFVGTLLPYVNYSGGILVLYGIISFLISDACIAFKIFRRNTQQWLLTLINPTYLLAQLLIMKGILLMDI